MSSVPVPQDLSRRLSLSDRPIGQLSCDGHYLLLSDLHIGGGGHTDLFHGKDREFLAMLDSVAEDVDAVVLNGDIFDAVQAHHAERISRSHPEVVARLAALSREVPVHLVSGNHDMDAFTRALTPAVRVWGALKLGEETLVIHGHQLDIHFRRGPLSAAGVWSLRAHNFVEQLTDQHIRLPFSRHDCPANRFAHWAFYRIIMAEHLYARLLSSAGFHRRLKRWAARHDFWSRSQWGDSHALLLPCLNLLATTNLRVLITGHAHQAGVVGRFDSRPSERVSGQPPLPWRSPDRRAPGPSQLEHKIFVNLGSWTFQESTYGLWRGGDLQLRDWQTQRVITDEAYRIPLAAEEIPGMREWWRRYYRGFLRYDTEGLRADRAALGTH